MEKIVLNQSIGNVTKPHDYVLSTTKKYVINLEEELPEQISIMTAIQTMGLDAITDWWSWLKTNGFSTDQPNPTNSFVEQFYGKSHLWKTKLSQGLVRFHDSSVFFIFNGIIHFLNRCNNEIPLRVLYLFD